jgi:hypothetical protein
VNKKLNVCIFCERNIEAGELARQDMAVIDNRYQKAWMHEVCSWRHGVRNLINALWFNLQEKRRASPVSR